MTAGKLFAEGRYQDLADRIDSREFDPRTARILTVCNPDFRSYNGAVSFFVSMKWANQKPLPPLRIFDPITLLDSAHRIDDLCREDGRIAFTLVFTAQSVPALGYKSFVAEYAAVSGPTLPSEIDASPHIVVETVPHAGNLPLSQSFG